MAFQTAITHLVDWMLKKIREIMKNTQDIRYYGGFRDYRN